MNWLVSARRQQKWRGSGKTRRARSQRVFGITGSMATLTVQHVASGLVPTYSAASSGGDKFLNVAGAILNAVNAGGGSITLTIVGQVACDLGVLHNKTLVLNAGQSGEIGTFDFHYLDTTGFVNVTYSGVSGLTVAVTAP